MDNLFFSEYDEIITDRMSSQAVDLYLESASDDRCVDIMSETKSIHLETAEHQTKVALLAACVVEKVFPDLKFADKSLLVKGCLVHDYGKAKLAELTGFMLDKPGPLTEEEWVIVRKHPRAGFIELLAHDMPQEAILSLIHHRYQERSYDSDEETKALLLTHNIPLHYLTDNNSALLRMGAAVSVCDQAGARVTNSRLYRKDNGYNSDIHYNIANDLTHRGGLAQKLGLESIVASTLDSVFYYIRDIDDYNSSK